ncbi:MAG: hypothetical protein V4608_06750 [Bacteroidota bacterium]
MKTLERAGFEFSLPTESAVSDAKSDVTLKGQAIQNSFCSIHFIGKKQLEDNDGLLMTEQDFNAARKQIEKDEHYKTFIWMPGNFDDSDAGKKQLDFINEMQHHLSNNMILSRVSSAIQFVEDVKLILEQQTKKVYETEPADVFLICNQTDEKEASRIQMMLSGVLKLVKLLIIQDADIDYEEYASQQMNVSKVSVVYYKNAADWAHPFVQQIWKKVGGAASKSSILYIRDAEAKESEAKDFSAPRVTSFTLPSELVPLEIKVQYDSLNEKK